MDEQAPKSGPFSPRMTCAAGLLATCLCLLVYTPAAMAQPVVPPPQPIAKADMGGQFTLEARSRERALIAEVREPELTLEVEPRTSKIIRTRKPVARLSITHPQILEVVQFGPMEFEMIGLTPGETSLTLWFADADGQAGREMLRYMVRVAANELAEDRRKIEYAALERRATELFPNSLIHLFPVGDKLIVRGQARDSREAGEILQFLGGARGGSYLGGRPRDDSRRRVWGRVWRLGRGRGRVWRLWRGWLWRLEWGRLWYKQLGRERAIGPGAEHHQHVGCPR